MGQIISKKMLRAAEDGRVDEMKALYAENKDLVNTKDEVMRQSGITGLAGSNPPHEFPSQPNYVPRTNTQITLLTVLRSVFDTMIMCYDDDCSLVKQLS